MTRAFTACLGRGTQKTKLADLSIQGLWRNAEGFGGLPLVPIVRPKHRQDVTTFNLGQLQLMIRRRERKIGYPNDAVPA
jgi:hypothetical protein